MRDKVAFNYLLDKKSFFWTPDHLDISAWTEHIPFAFWITETLKPKTILELGIHTGVSYFAFCQAVKRLNINTTCYGVDTWKGDEHSGFYGEEIFAKVSHYNRQEYSRFSTLIRLTFDEAKDYFIDQSIDLLHIDGLHTYQAVKHDFETWLPKLSANALVIFHDINVRERDFGVFKFWEELKAQYKHFQFDFGHGLGIISIGKSVPEELGHLLNEETRGDDYHIFLRNIFSEHGVFFSNEFNTSVSIRQLQERINEKEQSLAQAAENYGLLESDQNQLNASYAALEASNNQLQEIHKSLTDSNEKLKEQYTSLESGHGQLNASYAALEASNKQLQEIYKNLANNNDKLNGHFFSLQSNNNQLNASYQSLLVGNESLKQRLTSLGKDNNQRDIDLKTLKADHEKLKEEYARLKEKDQVSVAELTDKLNIANSYSNKVTKDATEKKNIISHLNTNIQRQEQIIQWYRSTYEDRSFLGVLKEKLKSKLKKKNNLAPAVNRTASESTVQNHERPEQAVVINTSSHANHKFNLLPVNDISFSLVTNEYSSTGPDPFFIIHLPKKQLHKGWYWLSIEIEELKGILAGPKLYFDYGKDFNEKDVLSLPPTKDGRIETLIKLPSDVKSLRFDPTNAQCVFRITDFQLKRVGNIRGFLAGISKHKELHFPYENKLSFYSHLVGVFLKSGKSELDKRINEAITYVDRGTLDEYRNWCGMYDTVSTSQLKIIEAMSARLVYQLHFSIVMPVYNAPVNFLKKAIESVRNQAYKNWEICIADDKSSDEDVRKLLKEYQAKDSRIKVKYRDVNGHISHASNSALELAVGDYIVLLDQDDELPPHCLYMVAKAINENKRLELIYSDEDKIDEIGNRFNPYFKTDWDKDLFYGQNMISHLGVYKHSLLKKVKGFRPGYEGSQDYDLALRCIEHLQTDQIRHLPHVLYHWRAIEGSTSLDMSNKNYAFDAGFKAIQGHLKRTQQKAIAEPNIYNSYRVKWDLPEKRPLVSIIVPTKDNVNVLSTCVKSVLDKTGYKEFEMLIIDNNSEEASSLTYFDTVQQQYQNVKVHQYAGEFNFSAIVNYGVSKSKGEVVLLLNNDTEVINEEWLEEMVSQCLRKDVGAVGAKLFYPNGQIQHAGVFLYEGNPGNHIYLKRQKDDPGYFNKLNLVQQYSAVTAACLAIRKELYLKVKGFDEENLKIVYNDVDFCLKIRELGYRNLWTPFAQLFHHESLSRGNDLDEANLERFMREHGHMITKWGDAVRNDPFFNPNLDPAFDPTKVDVVRYAFPPRIQYEWQIDDHRSEGTTNGGLISGDVIRQDQMSV